MTITISVKLMASLAKFKPQESPEQVCEVKLPEGATVEQLARQLGIPIEKVRTISQNSNIVKIDSVLNNGDELILFPTIAGG